MSGWAARKAAILEYFRANAPIDVERIDFSALMNGAEFQEPALPVVHSGMSPSAIAAARLGAVWMRPQLVSSRNSGKPFCRGAAAPTLRRGGVLTAIFAPAAHGDDFGLDQVVSDVEALLHRKFVGTARFGDCDEPELVDAPAGAKFEQTNVFHPFLAIDELVAD